LFEGEKCLLRININEWPQYHKFRTALNKTKVNFIEYFGTFINGQLHGDCAAILN